MSVKNVTALDVALVDLLETGRAGAPPEALAQLRGAGYVAGGKLTDAGRVRARKLKAHAADLRAMAGGATAAGGMKLRAVAAPGVVG